MKVKCFIRSIRSFKVMARYRAHDWTARQAMQLFITHSSLQNRPIMILSTYTSRVIHSPCSSTTKVLNFLREGEMKIYPQLSLRDFIDLRVIHSPCFIDIKCLKFSAIGRDENLPPTQTLLRIKCLRWPVLEAQEGTLHQTHGFSKVTRLFCEFYHFQAPVPTTRRHGSDYGTIGTWLSLVLMTILIEYLENGNQLSCIA